MPGKSKLTNDDSRLERKLGKQTAARRSERRDEMLAERIDALGLPNDLASQIVLERVAPSSIKRPLVEIDVVSPERLRHATRLAQHLGFLPPTLIAHDGTIISDRLWLEVAERLGFAQVPVARLPAGISDTDLNLARIAYQSIERTRETDVDGARLVLQQLKIDLEDPTLTGLSVETIDIILNGAATSDPRLDELPDMPAAPVTRVGDLWLLGRHRLLCGSALEADCYAKLMGGQSARVVMQDPPWNLKTSFFNGKGKTKHGDFVEAAGEMTATEFQAFLDRTLVQTHAILVDGGVAFVWIDWRSIHRVILAAEAAGLTHINLAVWSKGQGGMGLLYRSAHELAPVFCKGAKPAVNNVQLGRHGRDRTNVWEYASAMRRGSSANKALALHPSPKSVECIADAILDVSHPGDIVCDPFLGSGTTLIACEAIDRVCHCIDLDPKYVDVAIRRWEGVTGKRATLVETGETFDQVARRRDQDAADIDQGEEQ